MQELLEVMRRLRGPGGCPWDRQQTHQTLKPYLLEEAAEAVDAIHSGDAEAVVEELGDVLLQIAFHAAIAEETGAFSYQDIEQRIVAKLVERHPHVFADTKVEGAADVVTNWQRIKAREKRSTGSAQEAGELVPRGLPALMRASELGKKLDWDTATPEQILEVLKGPDASHEEHVGKLLLAVTDYARSLGVNPEMALRAALDARSGQLKSA